MYRRPYLQIPGPTNIPEPVLNALNHSAINHRGAEFAELLSSNLQGLKEVFKTDNDILIFPASGSGGLEAVIVNLLSPGDKVLCFNLGVFSERFAVIARKFGCDVELIELDWGSNITEQVFRDALAKDFSKSYKAVLVTHNETATGVTNDIAMIRRLLDEHHHPALLLVDAVSSLAITDLPTDGLRIDAVVSASQKGLMLPGGLAFVCISSKAWEAHRQSKAPKWYWNFSAMKEKNLVGQMPYTPAISLFFGLKAALQLIREEGLENVFHRHQRNATAVQAGITALGLDLLAKDPQARSAAVTAVLMPQGMEYKSLSKQMSDLGVIIGGGLQRLDGKIFRIGHLGMLHELEVIAILSALEMSLKKLGYPVQFGQATAAAMSYFIEE